jgi:hypothetical protein
MRDALAELRRVSALGVDDPARPDEVHASDLVILENVFQPRSGKLNVDHAKSLRSALIERDTLDAILVWRCGPHIVLVDGHHRVAAYRRHEAETQTRLFIPVRWIEGPVEKAVIAGGRNNTKAKLTTSTQERSDYAWRLVLTGDFSKRSIVEAASVTSRTVANMRAVMKALEDPHIFTHWRDALSASRKFSVRDEDDWSEDANELIRIEAEKVAERMTKTFSTTLAKRPEVTAHALGLVLGRSVGRVVDLLQDWVGDIDDYEQDDDRPEPEELF